jgi:hypothetical protein
VTHYDQRRMNMDNKMLTVDSVIFKKYEDEIERLQKEIAEWKEKEFIACSKHHEFIANIERLEEYIDHLEHERNLLYG